MKKVLIILFLVMLVISMWQINSLYALYKTQLDGEYNTFIGAWNILVDNNDITTNPTTMSFDITDAYFKLSESDVVKNNKIAPGREGYFDLVIDASKSDVSIVYNINIKLEQIANASIEIVNIENYFQVSDETAKIENTKISTEGNIHKGVFPIDKIGLGYKNIIRVNFIWKNYEEKNKFDTILGTTEDAVVTIPIETVFKQYTGEDL